MIKRIFKKLFPFNNSPKLENNINVSSEAKFIKHASSKIINCNIQLQNNAELIIEENVVIENYTIRIIKGNLVIGRNTQFSGVANSNSNSIYIDDGELVIANNCIIQAEFCVRFGGKCSVGSYTGIMCGTEIRCDELLSIGKYNMISYECMIYDTNTHVSYTAEKRRELTEKYYPFIGLEIEKPETKPIIIGHDCWLGKRCVILKGVNLGNETTVATNAVVTKSVPDNSLVYGNPAIFKQKTKPE